MGAPRLAPQEMARTLEALQRHGNAVLAAKELGIPASTLRTRLHRAKVAAPAAAAPQEASQPPEAEDATRRKLRAATDEARRLREQLARADREHLDTRRVREILGSLGASTVDPAPWMVQPRTHRGDVGTPTLCLSDLHWGEVVRSDETGGHNAYDLQVARDRLRRVTEGAIALGHNHLGVHENSGIVVLLGGDLVTGDIHSELQDTNELPILPTCLDLGSHLITAIGRLADAHGRVHVVSVVGNHGRTTHKPRHKTVVHTSYDWLVSEIVARHFRGDSRVTFQIPTEPDALYRLHNTRYLLTHGDRIGATGGLGIAGSLPPIMRGAIKTRAASGAIGRDYDVLVMGHWHTYVSLRHLIVNGSLKGWDEFARSLRCTPEPAMQAYWLTHPQRGVTISAPIWADPPEGRVESSNWVSVRGAA